MKRVELRNSGNILVQDSCPKNSLVRKAVSKDPFQEVDSWLKLETCKELRSLEESDPDIGFILRQKEAGTVRPKWEDISCKGQELKCYWAQWERLFVKNGLLYRKWLEQSEKQPIYQLIVPKCLRNEVLSLLLLSRT